MTGLSNELKRAIIEVPHNGAVKIGHSITDMHPHGAKKVPVLGLSSFFLLSPRIFLVVLSSRSYDDVSYDVTLLLMTWHSTAVLKSCTVQLYSTMDSMGTRARGWHTVGRLLTLTGGGP